MIARLAILAALLASASILSSGAAADPLRLRSDAFVAAEPPVGLLTLQGSDRQRGWLDAEALVWVGADELDDEGEGDVLVVTARLRDPEGRGELRLGRFIAATGAIRPVHIDGAAARGRSSWGSDLEVFGGAPVVPHFGVDANDWVVGARASHRLDRVGTVGVSYIQMRDNGDLANEEVGIDAASRPLPWLDIAAKAALDLIDPGLAATHLSAAATRGKAWRFELFGARRSPSRLLPATSIFAALGDVASDELGGGARWRAAPRLDVWASLAYRSVDTEDGFAASSRALLRLDDRGAGALSIELRRNQLPGSSWTGVRGTARMPLPVHDLAAMSELELVIPDDSAGRGGAWPWALVALAWKPAATWEISAAIEARASPESTSALDGLLRVTRRWSP